MRIHELRLQNFRRFEDVTIPFPERFSVLVGDNGMGKTSVLDAVARVLRVFPPIPEFRNHAPRHAQDVRKIMLDGQMKPQFPSSIRLEISIDESKFFSPEITWSESMIPKLTSGPLLRPYADLLREKSREVSGVVFPILAYYGTGRLWSIEKKKLPNWTQEEGIALGYQNCLNPKVNPEIFLSWIKVYEDEINKFHRPIEISQFAGFKDAVLSMLEGWFDFAYSFKFDALIFKGKDKEGISRELDFRQLSDGYRGVIGMVADMAYRCIQLNPHLGENAVKETPGVVLIDELDLHLHPNWQRNIVADLKRVFPKVQFIATTHSPFIVQSLKAEELIILDDDAERGGDPRKRSVEEIASMEMGVDDVKRSERFLEMEKAASEYLQLVEHGKNGSDHAKTEMLKAKLDLFQEEFAEEPAFVAMLKLKRLASNL